MKIIVETLKEMVNMAEKRAIKDNEIYERGRNHGYEDGLREGMELKAEKSEGISKQEYDGLMKYYLDTEFIEGFHKPLFGKKRHYIDLISIGIVAEDGREYYAISNEFNLKDANRLCINNPLWNIYKNLYRKDNYNNHLLYSSSDYDSWWVNVGFKRMLKKYGKSNKQIAEEIKKFVNSEEVKVRHFGVEPEFYAYYADYHWVSFCSLFGRMIDLPKGFPMYCKDLKQILDEKANIIRDKIINNWINYKDDAYKFDKRFDGYEKTTEGGIKWLRDNPNKYYKYPKQENEHNALDDAKWNKKLHEFLNQL